MMMIRPTFQRVALVARSLRRNMAGGGFEDGVHAPPNAAGRVQEVFRIGGAYIVVITLAVLFSGSGGKKKVDKFAHAPAPVVEQSSGDVPSVDSPQFGDWISKPGNADAFFGAK
jgi:hypothetical protein